MIEEADSVLVAELRPAANFEPRRNAVPPDILLLHYTGMLSCAMAIDWLTRAQSRVSCHYVVDVDGRITQLVAESERAWHAGAGSWQGDTDINSRSIGIEIHNPGHELGYPEFPDAQMRAVEDLCGDIMTRRKVPSHRVLAHSDIAPARKIDPGEKFSWAALARACIGHWVPPAPVAYADPGHGIGAAGPLVSEAQHLLGRYGYDLHVSGRMDQPTATVLRAFQRHFRPARVDGCLDQSTLDTLCRLIAALPPGALPGPVAV